MPRWVRAFRQRWPQVGLELIEATGDVQLERQGDNRWLRTSLPADQVWDSTRSFWQEPPDTLLTQFLTDAKAELSRVMQTYAAVSVLLMIRGALSVVLTLLVSVLFQAGCLAVAAGAGAGAGIGRAAGARSTQALFSAADLVPTLLDSANVKVRGGLLDLLGELDDVGHSLTLHALTC